MAKYKTWSKLKEEIEKNFTEEDFAQVEFEKQIIEATINARKKSKLTQEELSKKSGIKQPNIAKIEAFTRVPKYTTLIRLLYPMGYTIQVVPIKKIKRNYADSKR